LVCRKLPKLNFSLLTPTSLSMECLVILLTSSLFWMASLIKNKKNGY
jgi:hypothetical protein